MYQIFDSATPMSDKRHFVALSGGKDSTALVLRLAEINPGIDFEPICTPTGNELPEMFAHWRYLEGLIGKKILQVKSEHTLESLIDYYSALPNDRMRWCTRILKIEPTLEFLEKHSPCIFYVGLRYDEPEAVRGGGVYDDIDGVEQVFPLREWGWREKDVWDYLQKRGVNIPRRTDCDVCYHQRLGEWYNLWKDNPERFESGIQMEARVSKSRGRPHTLRNSARDTWPASLAELGEEFKRGRIPAGADVNIDLFGGGGICRVCTM